MIGLPAVRDWLCLPEHGFVSKSRLVGGFRHLPARRRCRPGAGAMRERIFFLQKGTTGDSNSGRRPLRPKGRNPHACYPPDDLPSSVRPSCRAPPYVYVKKRKSSRQTSHVDYLRAPRPAVPLPESSQPGCVDLFDAELDYIFATLRRLGAAKAELEDLAQEVFVVLHRNWSQIDIKAPMRPYLFGVSFRVFSAHRRRQKREIPYATVEVEDVGLTPEGSLGRKEAAELLLAALGRMPLRRRAVVVMHELDEIPVADIARHLSISPFSVYARLRKARKELRSEVQRLTKGERPR